MVESFGDLRNLATVAAVVIATCLIYVVYKNFKVNKKTTLLEKLIVSVVSQNMSSDM